MSFGVECAGFGGVVDSCRRSSGPRPSETSSTGWTPTRRRHQLAIPLRATRAGRVSHMNPRMGIASRVADFSGWAIAHDLGAISPTTRWTKVTTISESTNATTSAVTSGRPQPVISGVIMWWTAGLVMAPNAKVQRVMPSCEPASSIDRSRALRNAARAAMLVSAASSRRWRRAATSANSIATKNALSATIAAEISRAMPVLMPLIGTPPASGPGFGAGSATRSAALSVPPSERCVWCRRRSIRMAVYKDEDPHVCRLVATWKR